MSKALDKALAEIKPTIYCYGGINALQPSGSPAYPTLTAYNDPTGIVSGGRITIKQAGIYHCHVRQLCQCTTNAVYLHLRKNGATLAHGYTTTNEIDDLIVDVTLDMAVGDYFDIAITLPNNSGTFNSWGGAHSSFLCYRLP